MLVILLVKSDMFPTTLLEKLCTPVTIEAAKSAPGKCGSEGVERPVDGVVARVLPAPPETAPPKDGSYRGHQIGTITGPCRKTSRVRSS